MNYIENENKLFQYHSKTDFQQHWNTNINMNDGKMSRGRCKRFDPFKGYGFITLDDGSTDIFVHYSDIKKQGFKTLSVDERVEFIMIIQYDGKRKAINVISITGLINNLTTEQKTQHLVYGYARSCNINNIVLLQLINSIIKFYGSLYFGWMTMTLKQASKLKEDDELDFRNKNGKFVQSKVCYKKGTYLVMEYDYDDDAEYGDYSIELSRFAPIGSISQREAHRLTNLKVGDLIDINPLTQHRGWRKAKIRRFDNAGSGQIEVIYKIKGTKYVYWVHLDNEMEVVESGRMTCHFGKDEIEINITEYMTELLIYGYIRKQEKYHNKLIPLELSTILIVYYGVIPILHMTFKQVCNLKVGDCLDYKNENGRFLYGKIIKKDGSRVKIDFVEEIEREDDVWIDYTEQAHKLAKAGSISERKAHRFKTVKVGDLVDINPRSKHRGWKEGIIRELDVESGQVQVRYDVSDLYWIHLDDEMEIAEFESRAERFGDHGSRLTVHNEMYNTVRYGVNSDDQIYNTVFGDIEFGKNEQYVFEWKFKIIGSAWGISIGIKTSDIGGSTDEVFTKQTVSLFGYSQQQFYYGISNGGYEYSVDSEGQNKQIDNKFVESQGFKANDFITMRVDVPKQKITYYLGGYHGDKQMHFSQNVVMLDDDEYRMAVSIGYPGSGVQLHRFQRISPKS